MITVIIFLLIGSYIIVQAHSIDLRDGGDRKEFIYKFARWTFQLGGNIADLVGSVIALDWLPDGVDDSVNESG